MIFKTLGNKQNPAILFFHAMGVTGDSSLPVINYLKDNYYCILPTSTVYCKSQRYQSKSDELKQVNDFLNKEGIKELELVVASSIGADLAITFIKETELKIDHVFFDGGQFAQINKALRIMMTPFLYLAIKSFAWTKAKSLKYIMWCDDENIKPYFIAAGENITFRNLYHQMLDSLENKPFPHLDEAFQTKIYFEFGSIEDHFKYRDNVIKAYPKAHYPIFKDYNHMQFQIRDPKGFAKMLLNIMRNNDLGELSFLTNKTN